jgi:hypothetical protein
VAGGGFSMCDNPREGLLTKIRSWMQRATNPEDEAETARRREELETIRTSQLSPAGGSNLPPTSDVTDPRD